MRLQNVLTMFVPPLLLSRLAPCSYREYSDVYGPYQQEDCDLENGISGYTETVLIGRSLSEIGYSLLCLYSLLSPLGYRFQNPATNFRGWRRASLVGDVRCRMQLSESRGLLRVSSGVRPKLGW